MTLDRSVRNVLAVFFMVGALLLMAAVIAVPFVQLSRFDADIAAKNAELLELRRKTADESRLRAENENLVASGQSTNLLLDGETTGISGASLQRLINDRVLAHGGTASSLQVLPPADENDLVRISLSLSISVGIDGLHALVHDLETAQPLIFIDDIRIRSGQDEFTVPEPHYLGPLDITLQVSAFAPKKDEAR
jgi:general secretion pathway protein M